NGGEGVFGVARGAHINGLSRRRLLPVADVDLEGYLIAETFVSRVVHYAHDLDIGRRSRVAAPPDQPPNRGRCAEILLREAFIDNGRQARIRRIRRIEKASRE